VGRVVGVRAAAAAAAVVILCAPWAGWEAVVVGAEALVGRLWAKEEGRRA